jgi:hypothetical protein
MTVNVIAAIGVHAAEEYSFKVHNSTDSQIKKILVSEDRKTWGQFDIGKNIKPGETVTLVWDSSTNEEDCNQYVKAVFGDGSESVPSKFDFCEKGLDLEF